jgi:nicotinic acid mononucleotide adenylyltransferase
MSLNREVFDYPFGQKERLLEALTSGNNESIIDTLALEFDFLCKGKTMPDFLEILPGSTLLECMQILGDLFSQTIPKPKMSIEPLNNFKKSRNRRFDEYITALSRLIDDPNKHSQINTFVYTKRKYMGMTDDLMRINELSEMLQYADGKGLLSRESVAIIHYPGTFNPFPHKGHIEVARMAQSQLDLLNIRQLGRTVISTNATHPDKPGLSSTFYQRLDNLQRGFFNEEYVSVVGIVGDLRNREHRIHQLSLIAQFDFKKRLRFVIGSDGLLSKVQRAIDGDKYYQFLLEPDNQIFISPRIGDSYEQIEQSIDMAKRALHSNIIILPLPHEAVSGSFVRSLPTQRRRKYAPNKYVRLRIK